MGVGVCVCVCVCAGVCVYKIYDESESPHERACLSSMMGIAHDK